MECRLKSSDKPWFCQVSLRWEVETNGSRKAKPFEVPFCDPFSDEDHVETVLKRAQLAILNPLVDSSKFVNLDLASVKPDEAPFGGSQLSFSPNVVCVDVSGPELTDLSFIDLPGKLGFL